MPHPQRPKFEEGTHALIQISMTILIMTILKMPLLLKISRRQNPLKSEKITNTSMDFSMQNFRWFDHEAEWWWPQRGWGHWRLRYRRVIDQSLSYHPCHVGEVLMNRYVLIQKLGWGHFSTVWLAKDFKYSTYVAVKIMKSAKHYLEASYDEVMTYHDTDWNLAESGEECA